MRKKKKKRVHKALQGDQEQKGADEQTWRGVSPTAYCSGQENPGLCHSAGDACPHFKALAAR